MDIDWKFSPIIHAGLSHLLDKVNKLDLQSVDDIDKLEYVFNKKKLAKLGDEVAQRNFVKEEFRKLMSKNADDLFKPVNQGGLGKAKMQELFDVDNARDFQDIIDDISDEAVYGFIKIK